MQYSYQGIEYNVVKLILVNSMKGTMSATPPDPGLWPIGEARQIVMVHLATKILLTKSLTLEKHFCQAGPGSP